MDGSKVSCCGRWLPKGLIKLSGVENHGSNSLNILVKRLASVSILSDLPTIISWRLFTDLPLPRPEVWCIFWIVHFKSFLWTEFARRGYQTHEYIIGEHWRIAKADKCAGIYANPTNQLQVLEQNQNPASAQISAFQTDWVVWSVRDIWAECDK